MEECKSFSLHRSVVMAFLIFFCNATVGGDDPVTGYHPEERDALYTLKLAFNHTRLNKEWNSSKRSWYGITCKDGRVTGILLEGLGLSGQVNVNALGNLTQLTHLSFKNNSISGYIMNFSANGRLVSVDLSNNMFEGPISPSLADLNFLESLQLYSNFLSGSIPNFKQASLQSFNVSNNNLSGKIPDTPVLQSFNMLSYSNNPGLCGPPCLACPLSLSDTSDPQPKKSSSSLINITLFFGITALVLVIILIIKYYRKIKLIKREELDHEVEINEKGKKMEMEEERLDGSRVDDSREQRGNLSFIGEVGGFGLDDVLKASAEGLGKSHFGYSYKVMLEDRPAVVVKRLRGLKPFTSEEFAEQMRVLADLKHPNLLPLLAYFNSKDDKLLIFKFVQNGNLFERLHRGRGKNRIPFKWKSRLSVAQGVARAMAFLHRNTDAQNTIPHGNLKSSNVLLDENNVALVSHYGFASFITATISIQHMVSYKSPEYQQSRRISRKSDVWCYGLLLLELVTGKVSSYSAPVGVQGVDLSKWAHKAVREEWTVEVFDVEVSATEGAMKLLQIALLCCEKSPEKRPDMEQVMREVEDIKFYSNDDDLYESLSESFN